MGTLFQRRHVAAAALIALLAIVAYTISDSNPPAVTTAPAKTVGGSADALTQVETEVLAEVELSAPAVDVDTSGFTGDVDVDLATIDPGVLLVGDFRIKYIAPTDELVMAANAGGAFSNIALDMNQDGLADVSIAALDPVDGTDDVILSIPAFSQLPASDPSLDFDILAAVADAEPVNVLLQATLGDFVFADLNDNGLQDADELGIAGVTVLLLDETGAELGQAVTNAAGNYEFSVAPGTYALVFEAQPGTGMTERGVGEDRAIDSNATQLNGRTLPIFIAPGETNLTIDAGLTA